MKHKILLLSLLIIAGLTAFAQKERFKFPALKNDTYLRGEKIHFETLKNTGQDNFIDVNEHVRALVDKVTMERTADPNSNQITSINLFRKAENSSDADCIISGEFAMKKETQLIEKQFLETSSQMGSPIPYFEQRRINQAEVFVVLFFTYRDGSQQTDTLSLVETFEERASKKYLSAEDLAVRCQKRFESAFYNHFYFIHWDEKWIEFPTVKVKDKQLKEKYKGAKELIKKHEIAELTKIYKEINASEPSDESAICLAICNELLGNYQQAAMLYEGRSDFHIKVRMKSNMELLNYLRQIGARLNLSQI